MLTCFDPIDSLYISDINDVLRTSALIRTSNRRDHAQYLFVHISLIKGCATKKYKGCVTRKKLPNFVTRCTKDLFTLLRVHLLFAAG